MPMLSKRKNLKDHKFDEVPMDLTQTGVRRARNAFHLPLLVAIFDFALAGQATALTFSVLHTFSGDANGGAPIGGLVLSGSTLYGTTSIGGIAGEGTVFAIQTDGNDFVTLYRFTAIDLTNTNNDGASPSSGLVLSSNTLYGTAAFGGSWGNGTIFAVNTDGTGFRTLHSFTDGLDGAIPEDGLVLSGGTLYGTAQGNGAYSGTVFSVFTNGTGFAELHNFSGGDGKNPLASLTLAGNTLYGTTSFGGSSDLGTVFAVDTDGTGFKTLHTFSGGADGARPKCGLVILGNTLYGTTGGGGDSGSGTLFAINADGSGFTNLYSFSALSSSAPYTNADGAFPDSSLLLTGNTLYGTAAGGGISGSGTVFALHIDGSGFTNLYTFSATAGSPGRNNDGANPHGKLLLTGDTLFGTTAGGGTSGNGTVFSINLSSASSPQLTITPAGANVLLSWPTNFTGFTLQSTTTLSSPGWTTTFPAPVVVNGQYMVTNPISGTQQFYRLAQ